MNREDLRDQFAMAAMQGIISNGSDIPLSALAELAYAQADAMIDERDRRNTSRAQANPHHAPLNNLGMAGFLGRGK